MIDTSCQSGSPHSSLSREQISNIQSQCEETWWGSGADVVLNTLVSEGEPETRFPIASQAQPRESAQSGNATMTSTFVDSNLRSAVRTTNRGWP